MATTYRGLTIRIGGDTTSLQKSLRNVNKSISFTSGEIKKLGSAMKLDPTNVKAYTMQLGHMANQTVNVAQKLAELKSAADQIGKQKFTDSLGNTRSIEELASQAGVFGDNMENAAHNLSAAQTRAESLVDKITGMHREATAFNKEAQKMAKLQVQSAFSLAFDTKSEKQVDRQIDDLVKKLGLSSAKAEALKSDIWSLKDVIVESFGDSEKGAGRIASAIGDMIPAGVKVASGSIEQLAERAVDLGGKLKAARKHLSELRTGKDATTKRLVDDLAQAQTDLQTFRQESNQRISDLESELATLDQEAATIESEREQHRLGILEQESEAIKDIQRRREEADSEHSQKMDELNAKRQESIKIEQRAAELEKIAYSGTYMKAKEEYEERDRLLKAETARLREEMAKRKATLDNLNQNVDDIQIKISLETDDTAKEQLEQELSDLRNQVDQAQAEFDVAKKAWTISKNKSAANTKSYNAAQRSQILEENKALIADIGEEYDELIAKIADDVQGNLSRPFDGSAQSVKRLEKYITKLGEEAKKTRDEADELYASLSGKGYTQSQIESPELIEDKKDRREASEYLATRQRLNEQYTREARLKASLIELSEKEGQLAAEAANKREKAATEAAIAETRGWEQGEDAMHRMFDSIREETKDPIEAAVATNADDIENETRSVEELREARERLDVGYQKEIDRLDKVRGAAYEAYKEQEENTKKLKEALEEDSRLASETGIALPISRFDEVAEEERKTEDLRKIWKNRRSEQTDVMNERANEVALYDAKIALAEERAEQERTEAEREAAEERKRIAKEEAENKISAIMKSLSDYREADGVIDLSNVVDSDSLHTALEVAKTRVENATNDMADLAKRLREEFHIEGFDVEGFDASALEGEAKAVYDRYLQLSDYVGDANRDINTLNDSLVQLTDAESQLAEATAEAVKTPMQQILDNYHKVTENVVSESAEATKKIAESFSGIDEGVNESLGKVSNSFEELETVAKNIGDEGFGVERASEAISNTRGEIDALKESAKGYVEILREMGVDIASDSFDPEKLEGPTKLIYERYVSITGAIESAEDRLGKFSSAVDDLRSKEDALAQKRDEMSAKLGEEKDGVEAIASAQGELNDAVGDEAALRKSVASQIEEEKQEALSRAEAEDKIDDILNEQVRGLREIRRQREGINGLSDDISIDKLYSRASSYALINDASIDGKVKNYKRVFEPLINTLGESADDVLQEVFNRASGAIDKYVKKDGESSRSYLAKAWGIPETISSVEDLCAALARIGNDDSQRIPVINAVFDTLREHSQETADAMTRLREGVSKSKEEIVQEYVDLANKAEESLSTLAAISEAGFKNLGGISFKDYLSDIQKSWEDLWYSMGSMPGIEEGDELFAPLEAARDKIKSVMDLLRDARQNDSISELGKSIGESMEQSADKILTAEEAERKLNAAIEREAELRKAANDAFAELDNVDLGDTTAVKSVVDTAEKAFSTLASAIDETNQAMLDVNKANGDTSDSFDQIDSRVSELRESGTRSIYDFILKLKEMKQSIDSLVPSSDEMSDKVNEAFNGIENNGSIDSLRNEINGLIEDIERLEEVSYDKYSGIKIGTGRTIHNELVEEFEEAFNRKYLGFNELKTERELKKLVDEALSKIRAALQEGEDGLPDDVLDKKTRWGDTWLEDFARSGYTRYEFANRNRDELKDETRQLLELIDNYNTLYDLYRANSDKVLDKITTFSGGDLKALNDQYETIVKAREKIEEYVLRGGKVAEGETGLAKILERERQALEMLRRGYLEYYKDVRKYSSNASNKEYPGAGARVYDEIYDRAEQERKDAINRIKRLDTDLGNEYTKFQEKVAKPLSTLTIFDDKGEEVKTDNIIEKYRNLGSTIDTLKARVAELKDATDEDSKWELGELNGQLKTAENLMKLLTDAAEGGSKAVRALGNNFVEAFQRSLKNDTASNEIRESVSARIQSETDELNNAANHLVDSAKSANKSREAILDSVNDLESATNERKAEIADREELESLSSSVDETRESVKALSATTDETRESFGQLAESSNEITDALAEQAEQQQRAAEEAVAAERAALEAQDAHREAVEETTEAIREQQGLSEEQQSAVTEIRRDMVSEADIAAEDERHRQVMDNLDDEKQAIEDNANTEATLDQRAIENERRHAEVAEELANARAEHDREELRRQNEIGAKQQAVAENTKTTAVEGMRAAKEEIKSIQESMKDSIKKIGTKFGFEVFSSKNGNTDPEHVMYVLDRVIDYLGKGGAAAGVFRDQLAAMVIEYNNATEDIEKWELVEEFQDLVSEIEKTDASVVNLSAAISDMHTPDELMKGMVALDTEIKELSNALSTMTNIQGSMTKAMMADPSNITAMSLAMKALSEEERLVKEQMDAVGEKISRFDSEKIDQFADSTKSARKQLYDAAQEAAKAQADYAKAQGDSNKLQDERNKLTDQWRVAYAEVERLRANESRNKDEEEAYEAAEKNLDQINSDLRIVNDRLKVIDGTLPELKKKAEEAHSAEDIAKEREALEELRTQLVTLSNQYDELIQKSRGFAQSLAESTGSVFSENIFGESDMMTAKMESTFDSLVKRAEAFDGAFEKTPENMAIAQRRMESINEAIRSGVNLANEISTRMASVVPDEGMMNVQQIRETYGSIGDAARIAADAIEEYAFKQEQTKEALRAEKEGTDRYRQLTEDLEEYTTKLGEAQDLARNVSLFEHLEDDEAKLIAVNEQLRKLLEMRDGSSGFKPIDLNDDIFASVDAYAKTIRETFGTNLLAGFKRTFNELTSQIEAAKAKVKEIDAKIASGDKSESLVAERAKAIASSFDLADERAKLFLDTLGQFGSRNDFATIDARINKLNDDLVVVRANVERTLNELRKLANTNQIDTSFVEHIASEVLESNLSTEDFENMLSVVPEALRETLRKLRGLSGEQLKISEMLGVASAIKDMSALDSKAQETGETLMKSFGMKDVKFDDMLKSATSFVDTFKKTTGDMFTKGFAEQFNELTEKLSRAKEKVKEIDAEIKANGSTQDLEDRRVQAIADAVDIAIERTRLFNDMFDSLGGNGAIDGLTTKIREMGEEFLGIRMQIESIRSQIQQLAKEKGLDASWVDEVMKLGSRDILAVDSDTRKSMLELFNSLPPKIQQCVSDLYDLNAAQADLGEAFGPKLFMQALLKLIPAAKETAESVQNEFKKKVDVKVDNSYLKGLEEFSKRMKDFGFQNTGIDDALEDLGALGKQIKSNTEYYDELLKLLKDNPKNDFVRSSLTEASVALIGKLEKRIKDAKAALDSWDTKPLDMAAVSAGTVDSELEKANNAFNESQAKVKRLGDELEKAREKFNGMMSSANTSQITADIQRLEQELQDAQDETDQTKDRLEQMSNTKAYVQVQLQYVTDQGKLQNYQKSYSNGFKEVHEEVNRGSREMMQALQNVGQYAERMGDKIVESAQTIDAAYRDMRKTVNGTESQFESLREEAIKFSQTHAVSADTILEMESLGGQLGIVVEQLSDFGRIASNLDIATNISANDIALELGQISNIMSDLDYTNLENFADALVRLGNNAAAQESSIMDIAQRISAIANVTSMSTPQLLGWSAAIAETGQKSESAATALVKTVNNIAQAVAHGGEDLEAFAAVANMSADEFENAWRTSSSDALKAFVVGLAGLTDESADAIAALESVGIKAVRQETSLLALSQTIGKVDDNITMATDAFNGISDAWGKAGDSANEAEQKSKGFSGTLQIMQNNIQNLAASLGDGLIPFMKVLSGIVSGLTSFFSSLPPVVTSSITAIGGLLAVLGMVGPEINEIIEGWNEMEAKVNSGELGGINKWTYGTGQALGGIITNLKAMLVALKEVGVAMVRNATSGIASNTALSASFAGVATAASGVAGAFKALWAQVWPIALVTAILTGLSAIKDAYDEWKERQDLISQATKSFSASLNDANASVDEYVASLNSISTSAEKVDDELETFYQKQANFASTVSEAMGEYGKNTAEIERYAETIKRLSGNINDNKAQLALLQEAIDGYNGIAGSSIAIIDDVTGEISIQKDAMDMLTESYKKNAEVSAWTTIYKNAVQQSADATYELQKAELEYNRNKERMNELLKDGVAWFSEEHKEYQNLADANRKYSQNMDNLRDIEAKRKQEVADLEDIIKGLDTEQEDLTETVHDYSSALSIAGQSVDAFYSLSDKEKTKIEEIEDALNDTGDSLTHYGELNADQLSTLANAWDHNVDHIITKLREMQEAEEEANAGKPTDQQLEEFKRKNEAFYEDEKRKREDYYDSEKRLRDLYYEKRKRELDQEHEDFKNNLDRDYDDFKNTLDKAYEYEKRIRDDRNTARKNELDDEYEYEKRLRDKAYDDLKNDLDKEYEAEKRLRDDTYDDYKDMLDDEYEWEKRLRDDAYDDLKQTLDDAYDALKDTLDDALDEYKDTLDDMYDAAKDAVDDWLDDYKDALDEEVEAFEKATDEKLKLMEEEYEQKKKYIEDERDSRTDAIDEQIKAFKDQIKAEEKALKLQEREKKIAEATAKRDKYAVGSKAWEKYDTELQNLITEYNNEDIEEARDEYLEYLENLKDEQKDQADERLDELKDSYDKEKEEYQNARKEQLEIVKKTAEDEYETQKKAKEAELKLLKDANESAYEMKKKEVEAQLKLVKEANEYELKMKKRANEDELKEIKREQEDELKQLKRANEDELSEIKLKHEKRLDDLKLANEDELTGIKRRLDKELEDYKRANEDELTEIKNGQERQLNEYKIAQEKLDTKFKNDQEDHLELLKHYHEQELLEIKRKNDDELTKIKDHIDDENEAYKNGGQPAVDALNTVRDAAEATSTKITNAITDAAKSIGSLDSISSEAKDKITKALNEINAGLTSDDPDVVATTKLLVSRMSDELYQLVVAAQTSGTEVPVELSKAILENSGQTLSNLSTFVSGVTGTFGPISPTARSEMENAMLAISTTLTSRTPETVAAANRFVAENEAALLELVSAAQGVGIGVPPALASALLQNSGTLQTAAGNMADVTVRTLDAILPPGSSNAVRMALSSMLGEFGNESSLSSLANAATTLAKQVSVPLDQLPESSKTKIRNMLNAIDAELVSDDPNRVKAAEALVGSISSPLATLVDTAEKTGQSVPPALYAAMINAARDKGEAVSNVTDWVSKYFEALKGNMEAHGNNAMVGWERGFVNAFNNNVVPKVTEIANKISNVFKKQHDINSPSKLFDWFAEMDAAGFMKGWDKSSDEMIAMMRKTADEMTSGFENVDWSDTDSVNILLESMKRNQDLVVQQTKDMMTQMVETMREKEHMLQEQAERMARIMEDGFDPTLTAAYEAIGTINAGKLRQQQTVAAAQSVSNVTNAPVINITIPEVVIREQTDIASLSEQIARRVRRELSAAIG